MGMVTKYAEIIMVMDVLSGAILLDVQLARLAIMEFASRLNNFNYFLYLYEINYKITFKSRNLLRK